MAISALAAAFTLAAAVAHACETRPVAREAAQFDSCGTPWSFVLSNPDEDIYLCEQEGCPQGAILSFSITAMADEDRALDREALLDVWSRRQVPGAMGGFTAEMLAPISIETIGGIRGILIPVRLTETASGKTFVSVAFRIPRAADYIVTSVTAYAELPALRPLLDGAIAQLSLPENQP